MEPFFGPLAWVVMGLAIVAVARLAGKRRRGVRVGTGRLGVTLEIGGARGPRAEGPFPLFAADPGVKESILSDGANLDVETFDYRCDRGEDGLISHRRTCATTTIPVRCPPLAIARRGEPGPAPAALPAVAFEAAVFNDQVHVACADPRFAHALVDARMMEWLLLLPRGWGIQVAGERALVYGPVAEPWKREPHVALLADFLEHLPSSLPSLYPPS